MLKLTLRKEFQGRRLKGTAIELANSSNTGATQIAASEFLDINLSIGGCARIGRSCWAAPGATACSSSASAG